MGEVWVGLDPDLDRKVAIKLLRADRADRTVGVDDRAQQGAEARAMARLAHPNVVTIHDVGELDQLGFIATEFVDGESLAAWIDRGPHPWPAVLAIMRQAAAGLRAAHEVGLVHRDFKPSNVMIGTDGRVRVLDFGLARHEGSLAALSGDDWDDDEASSSSSTHANTAYMSPEQRRGAKADARSDLFSFCVTSFEAFYRLRPFSANGEMVELPELVRQQVPDWIHAVIMRGLASEAEQRLPDMDSLLAALERSPEQVRRRRWGIAGASVGVAAVLGLALAFMPERARDPCELAGEAITADWDAATRARLRARIDSVAAKGSLAATRVIEGVDRHVAAWSESRELLCRDQTAQRLTERLQTTREACLSRAREAMRTLVQLPTRPVTGGESDGSRALLEGLANRPFAGLRSLGDPTRCIDRAAPLDDRPVLSDDQRAARIELALALALVDVDQLSSAAIARVGDGCEVDEELECALLLARIAAKRGDRSGAEAQLHAITVAATRGQPKLAAQAWLALVELEVEALAKQDAASEPWKRGASVERAIQLIAYADAMLPKHETASRSKLALLAGRLALIDSRYDHRALLNHAIDAAGPREPDLLAAMLEIRARLHERDGKRSEAAIDRARARELRDSRSIAR